jgi:hypothetical protein
MPNFVFAQETCFVHVDHGSFRLTAGEPWADDDPVVVARPDLFADTPAPPFPRRSVHAVEQTTAAPGEKRGRR